LLLGSLGDKIKPKFIKYEKLSIVFIGFGYIFITAY